MCILTAEGYRIFAMSLESAIRRRRHALKMSQADLASALGEDYAHSNMSRIERGTQDVSFRQMKALACKLKCSVTELVAEADGTPLDGHALDRDALRDVLSEVWTEMGRREIQVGDVLPADIAAIIEIRYCKLTGQNDETTGRLLQLIASKPV